MQMEKAPRKNRNFKANGAISGSNSINGLEYQSLQGIQGVFVTSKLGTKSRVPEEQDSIPHQFLPQKSVGHVGQRRNQPSLVN